MMTGQERSAFVRPLGVLVLVLVCALALFAWTVQRAGIRAVGEGVARLGSGFALVLLLGGFRHLCRASAWRACMDDPSQLPLRSAFAAWLAGNSFGNVTPFGLLISEPSKIMLLRLRVPARDSISALTIENLCYAATVLFILVAGTGALLLWFAVPSAVGLAVAATLAVAAALSGAAAWVVLTRRPIVSGLATRLLDRGIGRSFFEARLGEIRAIESDVFSFAGRRPRTLLLVLGLEAGYHIAAIAEIWIVVAAITGASPSLFSAFVLEYVNRTITIVFQFVPLWIGVDEAASALTAGVLQLAPAHGVSLALIRKARVLCWTAVGLTLGVGWTARPRESR